MLLMVLLIIMHATVVAAWVIRTTDSQNAGWNQSLSKQLAKHTGFGLRVDAFGY